MTRARAGRMTEADYLQRIVDYARWRHCVVYHQRPARLADGQWRTALQGDPGFPDLTIARDRRVLFLEIKSAGGRATPGQRAWAAQLPDAHIVYPSDWPLVQSLIDGLATAPG